MGQSESCLNIESIQKDNIIPAEQSRKRKPATFQYIKPINFTKEDLSSMQDIDFEISYKKLKRSMQKDQQHSLTNVHACLSELKPAEVEKE